MTPKRHFEINWPLQSLAKCTCTQRAKIDDDLPLALIVSSDLNLRSNASSTDMISGGIWKNSDKSGTLQ